MSETIYKICPSDIWQAAEAAGKFTGAGIDIADGFIHFSTAAQAGETARLHFHGQSGLVLVSVDTASLEIKWEASRGGALFPHLYGDLPLSAVIAVTPMPLDDNDVPQIPENLE